MRYNPFRTQEFLGDYVGSQPPEITDAPPSAHYHPWLKYKGVLEAERCYGIPPAAGFMWAAFGHSANPDRLLACASRGTRPHRSRGRAVDLRPG